MIPNLAIIVSAYAAARLLNEYVLDGETTKGPRVLVAIVAMVVIAYMLVGILEASTSIGDLGL